MLAAAVRVHARVEADVGALVGGDDGARGVGEELRRGALLLQLGALLGRRLRAQGLEAVRGIAARAACPHKAKEKRISAPRSSGSPSGISRGDDGEACRRLAPAPRAAGGEPPEAG